MKTPLGTELDLGAGHIVLDRFPALRKRGTAPPPSFRPMSMVDTVAHLSYCWALVIVRQMQENFTVKGKKLYFGFVDLENAFNKEE